MRGNEADRLWSQNYHCRVTGEMKTRNCFPGWYDHLNPKTKRPLLDYLRREQRSGKRLEFKLQNTVIFMSAYVRTVMLTCNRNLHEYLAFWS